jgi:hypothetical protein
MTPAARAYAKLAAEKPVPLPSKEVPAGYDVRWPHDLLKRPPGGTGPGVDRPV